MGGTNKKLTTAVETYLDDLRRIRASGGATGERSSYGPLANLLNAVGATLKPKVFCVGELADQGAGHPDFGLYTAKQVQPGRPREGQAPERGVVCLARGIRDTTEHSEGLMWTRRREHLKRQELKCENLFESVCYMEVVRRHLARITEDRIRRMLCVPCPCRRRATHRTNSRRNR